MLKKISFYPWTSDVSYILELVMLKLLSCHCVVCTVKGYSHVYMCMWALEKELRMCCCVNCGMHINCLPFCVIVVYRLSTDFLIWKSVHLSVVCCKDSATLYTPANLIYILAHQPEAISSQFCCFTYNSCQATVMCVVMTAHVHVQSCIIIN